MRLKIFGAKRTANTVEKKSCICERIGPHLVQ